MDTRPYIWPSPEAAVITAQPLVDIPTAVLRCWVREARAWTIQAIEDLDESKLLGPQSEIVNPLLWEVGHVIWFQERWVHRRFIGSEPLHAESDELYNSSEVPHQTRWDLPLLCRDRVLEYSRQILERTLEVVESRDRLDTEKRRTLTYMLLLSVYHEDMHHEAFAYSRQTHGWSPPPWVPAELSRPQETRLPIDSRSTARSTSRSSSQAIARSHATHDLEFEGGHFPLGCNREERFRFDNEYPALTVEVAPFAMSRHAVTEGEFLHFVEAGGYQNREYWCEEGWKWCQSGNAAKPVENPVYWRRENGRWQRRRYDQWLPLRPHHPMIHVNWFEANAYCRFAERRLPTEAEWTYAANRCSPDHTLPWEDLSTWNRANLDARFGDVVAVNEFDSTDQCCQLIGNTWEWTSDAFGPFPGFRPGPYEDYSQPWFHDHKVLKGGSWHTRSRLITNRFRNFYRPHRRDPWVGFRTCSLDR